MITRMLTKTTKNSLRGSWALKRLYKDIYDPDLDYKSCTELIMHREEIVKEINSSVTLSSLINTKTTSSYTANQSRSILMELPYEQVINRIEEYEVLDLRREFELFARANRINSKVKKGAFKSFLRNMPVNINKDFFVCLALVEKESLNSENLKHLFTSDLPTPLYGVELYDKLDMVSELHILYNQTYLFSNLPNKTFEKFLGSYIPYIKEQSFGHIYSFFKAFKLLGKRNKTMMEGSYNVELTFIELGRYIDKNLISTKSVNIMNPRCIELINEFEKLLKIYKSDLRSSFKARSEIAAELMMKAFEKRMASQVGIDPFEIMDHKDILEIFKLMMVSKTMREQREANKVYKAVVKRLTEAPLDKVQGNVALNILDLYLDQKMKIPLELGNKLLKNQKMLRLRMQPILPYKIISVFAMSNISLTPAYNELVSMLKRMTVPRSLSLYQLDNLLMLFRSIQYFSDNRLKLHHLNVFKMAIPSLLHELESRMRDPVQLYIPTIKTMLELAAICTRHLEIPNLMFDYLMLRIDEVKVDQTTRADIRSLILIMVKRFEAQYSLQTDTLADSKADIEINLKWTPGAIQLLQAFLHKFHDSSLISFHFLSAEVLQNKKLADQILDSKKSKKIYLKRILEKVGQYIAKAKYWKTAEQVLIFLPVLKTMSQNIEAVHKGDLILFYHRILDILSLYCAEDVLKSNKMIEFYYYLSFAFYELGRIRLAGNRGVVVQKLKERLGKLVSDKTLVEMAKNQVLLGEEVDYEPEVKQSYIPGIITKSFHNYELLPGLMGYLSMQPSNANLELFAKIYLKTCKFWYSRILVDNVLRLESFGIFTPEMAVKLVPNLSTLVEFEVNQLKNSLDKSLSLIDVSKLVKIFTYQLSEAKKKIPEFDSKHNLYPLSLVASCLESNLKHQKIRTIIKVLGTNTFNYSSSFISLARSSRLAAHLTTKEVIKELKSYPHIIQPNSLLDIFTTLPTQDLAEIPVDDLLELGINSRLDSKKIFFDKKFGVLVNLLKAEIKQKEQILPILDYFSRVSPPVQLLTPNLIQNLLESIFALKGEMSREQLKNALLVCTMLVKGLAREDVGEEDYFDISERFTSLVMRNQGLRDLVREVLHHDEFGFCFTSFVSDSGEKIEIGFFKSIDLSRSDQRRFASSDPVIINPIITFNAPKKNPLAQEGGNGTQIASLTPTDTTGWNPENRDFEDSENDYFDQNKEEDADGDKVGDFRNDLRFNFVKELQEKRKNWAASLDFTDKMRDLILYKTYTDMVVFSNTFNLESFIPVFEDVQYNYRVLKKSQDHYSDFLVDLSMIIHSRKLSFMTDYSHEAEEITIDLYVPDKKLGFVYIPEEVITNRLDERGVKKHSVLTPYELMREYFKWRYGITLEFVYYRQWDKFFPDMEMKGEYFDQLD